MTGYELSRAWFDFAFDNPEKIKPIHSAIFFFACEHQNRLGGKEKFGFPSQMTMEAIGVKKHQTYISALNDLEEWGFIVFIERSKNQYSANIISIALPKKGKALDKALDKALVKHGAKQGQSTGQSKGHINKQLNNKQLNEMASQTLVFGKDLKNHLLNDEELISLVSELGSNNPQTDIRTFCVDKQLEGGRSLSSWRSYCYNSIRKMIGSTKEEKTKEGNKQKISWG